MTKDEFAQAFATALNREGIELWPDSVFSEMDFWDSLCVLMTIAFADEQYGKALSGRQIARARTVSDLHRLLEASDD